MLVLVAGMIAPSSVSAQAVGDTSKWWNIGFKDFSNKVNGVDTNGAAIPDNEIFGERYTFAQVNWIVNSLAMLQLGGGMASCFGSNPPGGSMEACIEQVQAQSMSSPLMFLATMNDTMLSVRPASGLNYVAQKIDQVSPIKTAYAQTGFGYRTIAPLQRLWTSFRNIAFGMTAFAIIILAFMIMLRQKISPQVVITAQSALPKLAIALVFITFSYAIAGLLIDFAYVVMGLGAAVIGSSGLLKSAPSIVEIFDKVNNPISGFAGWTLILGAVLLAAPIAGAFTGIITGGLGAVIGAVSGIIAVILLALALVAIFRIFITMLRSFATIVFLVIGGPIIGVMSVLSVGPGIGGWIKQMVAQLSVFVTICLVMLLSHMIFWTMSPEVDGWLGDIVVGGANYYNFDTGSIGAGTIQFPGFGGFPVQFIGLFVGFGILFSAPKLAQGVRDQILTGRGSYGFDTWGTMAGPVAGVTAASYAAGQKYAGGLATTAFNNSRMGANVRAASSQMANRLTDMFNRGGGSGSTTQPAQNAQNSVKANSRSGPYDKI